MHLAVLPLLTLGCSDYGLKEGQEPPPDTGGVVDTDTTDGDPIETGSADTADSADPPDTAVTETGTDTGEARVEVTLPLRTDGSWKAIANYKKGWEFPGYDDSIWDWAASPAPNSCGWTWTEANIERAFEPWEQPDADVIWSQEQQRYAYMRVTFTIPEDASDLWGMVSTIVDDDYILYVNGAEAFVDANGGTGPVVSTDISALLTPGENVLAILGDDSVGGCRWAVLSGTARWVE